MSQAREPTRTPRYPFEAPAEVTPEGSQAPFAVKVTELGLSACYLETPSPFEPGTRVAVKIFAPGNYFEGNATVQQAQAGRGMALAFREVKPHFFAVLRNWVLRAMRGKKTEP